MQPFQQEISNPFPVFCLWLLSKESVGVGTNVFFTEFYIEKWFRWHEALFGQHSDKIVLSDVEHKTGFTTFISFYIYYLMVSKPDSNIAVIEGKPEIINLIRLIDTIMTSNFDVDHIETAVATSKIVFTNGSTLKTFRPSTYNIRNFDELEFVFFDKVDIKNTDKLIYDITVAKTTDEIRKMVLTITNDISTDFPEIKKVKIK